MKKIFCLIAIVVLVALSIVSAFAHSGRTDSDGGHYNHDTGEYHYHHGYSEHQHPNGVCPYENDEGIDWDIAYGRKTVKSSVTIDWDKAYGVEKEEREKRHSELGVDTQGKLFLETTTKAHKNPTSTKATANTTTQKSAVATSQNMPWYFWTLVGVTVLWTVPITFYVIYNDIARKKR